MSSARTGVRVSHSALPWTHTPTAILDADQAPVIAITGHGARAQANTARLLAAVNATAGLSDAALAADVPARALRALHAIVTTMTTDGAVTLPAKTRKALTKLMVDAGVGA